ncbi:MAG: rane protein-like [Candidatus Saccharibacteria bacterium]|nr:rane protein-like [Candidatus Saccharibacteria bacterium]
MRIKEFLTNRLKLWHVVLPLLLLANLAYFVQNIFGWAVTLGFFLFVPGYLLLTSLGHSIHSKVEVFSLAAGLSLFLMLTGGLLLNSLHAFGLDRPLDTVPIFVLFDLITLILLAFCLRKTLHPKMPNLHFSKEELVAGLILTALPLLSIGGAIRLNNGASNILTMIMMALVAVMFVWLAGRLKLQRLYPYAIFMVAVAVLFGNSLRGWNITGHDIHHEFSVFQNAIAAGYWNKTTVSGDPYNACLSITILPTLIAKLTTIPDAYVFKVIFQVLFASFLPALFCIFRRFATKQVALIGVFAFMTFPTFTNDMPFLNRQEIAFIFFILMMMVNFMKIPHRLKTSLTVMFIISLILSHYSSSYVTFGVFLVAPIFYKFLSRHTSQKETLYTPLRSLPIIALALIGTFLWNVQITASTGNLNGTLKSTYTNLFGASKDKDKFSYSLFSPPTPQEPIVKFNNYKNSQDGAVKLVPAQQIPVTGLGSFIGKMVNVNVHTVNVAYHAFLAKVLQLLVVAGTIVLVTVQRRRKPEYDTYLVSLICAFILFLALFTLLPQLSVDYDVTRLFQQSLIVLWLPSILISQRLFFFIKVKYRLYFAAAIYAILYLNLAGFVPQLTGGFPPQLPLNNSGIYYDYFYTQTSDIYGTKWLGQNKSGQRHVTFDTTSSSPKLSYPVGVGFVNYGQGGYLYLNYNNNARGLYRTIISGAFIEYTHTTATKDRNLIYSNGDSTIYFRDQRY